MAERMAVVEAGRISDARFVDARLAHFDKSVTEIKADIATMAKTMTSGIDRMNEILTTRTEFVNHELNRIETAARHSTANAMQAIIGVEGKMDKAIMLPNEATISQVKVWVLSGVIAGIVMLASAVAWIADTVRGIRHP